MLEKILKAKHWQLFVLVFGLPFVAQVIFMSIVFGSLEPGVRPTGFGPFKYMPLFFIFYLVAMVVLFSWYYAIVVKLDSKIPAPLKLNLKRFRFFFFFPLIYILVLLSVILLVFIVEPGQQPSPGQVIPFILLIIPLHLFSMFCIGHTFYCVGKSIKLAETQQAVKFEQFAGEFFLAWFYMIGFWIIQPKVNQLWANEIKATNQEDELV